MRRNVADHAFFATGLPYESDAALGQIPQPAVKQSTGTAAGTGREIGLLDDCGAKASHCGVACNAGADDAAADDEHVEDRFSDRIQHTGARWWVIFSRQ